MNKSLARSAIARTLVFLFVLVAAAGAQTYSVLTSFDGADGDNLYATPLIDHSGNVFGVAQTGGSSDCGVVYELVNNGGGNYTNRTLYSFTCGNDGGQPYGGLIDSAGDPYGTAQIGGSYGYGVVYELVNHGGGSYKFEVIHSFTIGSRDPVGDLAIFKGSLYGVTSGILYRLTKSGGKWVETVLHVFNDQSDGEGPIVGVTLDSGGNIYGTTVSGGGFGYGKVFKLSSQGGSSELPPESSDSYKETILHSFEGAADGCNPYSGVVLDPAGNLYGTASSCGNDQDGTVYELKRSGSKYSFKVILTFNGPNGRLPYNLLGHLALDSAGNLYGTTMYGGGGDEGTAFKLTAGSFLYTDLHDFYDNGTAAYQPMGGVSLDSLGNLYGTTLSGGSGGDGTVWQIANP
jgi:uncharacterized repeat protein (TIGR03803 family)